MTDNEKLTEAKRRLGISANTDDVLLQGYLRDAGYFLLATTGQATIPAALEGAQIDIAVAAYAKRGAEGESAHSEGGVAVTYEGLSPALQALIRAHTLAKVVTMN